MAFKIAASLAFQEAARKAGLVLLEPIMEVEVVAPEEYLGEVLSDLASRRGEIRSMDVRVASRVVEARVPLKEMFGYATTLRSLTQGRATFTMQLGQYSPVPSHLVGEIAAKVAYF